MQENGGGPHRIVNGLVLIDAPAAALNMQGTEKGQGAENRTLIKKLSDGQGKQVYVSAQAWRYWWRGTLETEAGWEMSPITKEENNQSYTQAEPWTYPDDDVFGYMRAVKKVTEVVDENGNPVLDKRGRPKTTSENLTLTRRGPLSCTPLIGIGGRITSDFSNMSRHEGNPVLYEKEFYSGILRGYFSLDLDVVGSFTCTPRSGFQNINKAGLEEARSMGAEVADDVALMDAETREARVTDVLSVLPYLSGGANQTLHLTDVSPKLVILAVVRGGNPLFMNVVHEVRGRGRINTDALAEVLTAYHDRFETNVYIGRRAGFLDEQARELADLAHAHNDLVNLSSLNLAINNFTEEISNVMVAS